MGTSLGLLTSPSSECSLSSHQPEAIMSAGILNEPNTTKTRTEKKANAQSALAPSYAEACKMIELDRRQPFSPSWGPRPDRGKAKAKEEAPDLEALPVTEHVLKSRQVQAAV